MSFLGRPSVHLLRCEPNGLQPGQPAALGTLRSRTTIAETGPARYRSLLALLGAAISSSSARKQPCSSEALCDRSCQVSCRVMSGQLSCLVGVFTTTEDAVPSLSGSRRWVSSTPGAGVCGQPSPGSRGPGAAVARPRHCNHERCGCASGEGTALSHARICSNSCASVSRLLHARVGASAARSHPPHAPYIPISNTHI